MSVLNFTSLWLLVLASVSCTRVETKFYDVVAQVNQATQFNDPTAFKSSMKRFSSFLQEHKLWKADSFLGRQGVAATVGYINCLEIFQNFIEARFKQQNMLNKWKFHALDVKNPLNKLSGIDPKKAMASIEDKIKTAQEHLAQLSEKLSQKRTECKARYAELVALHK